MNREGAVLVMVAIAVILLALMAWGWRRRTRRDAAPLTTVRVLPGIGVRFAVSYVGTTRAGAPTDRIAAPGLALGSAAAVTVAAGGVALDIPGQDRLVIPADAITAVGQATFGVDRVVERDGLVRVTWLAETGALVDTYLRPQDVSARSMAEAIIPLITDSRTGSAA